MAKANATTNIHSLGSAVYAAKRAADVVFVLQNKDQLDYAALIKQLNKTLREYGERNADLAELDLDELKVVSRKLHEVFAAHDMGTAAERVTTILQEYGGVPRLSAHDGSAWHIHVDSGDDATWAEWFASSSAMALATLLAEKQRLPGGLCASPSCGRPFVDLGKGGGRSYCSPRCATRERVAAHRKNQSA